MARFARKSDVADALLIEAVVRAEQGLVDANLGGGVIKQRVGREGQGRSGGYRTLIAFRSGNRAIFVFAFAKNDRGNIPPSQLQELRRFAVELLSMDESRIAIALAAGDIEEVGHVES